MQPPHDLLAWRAAATPHRPAVVTRQRTWRYADLQQAAQAWAAYLLHLGLEPGQRVAWAARPTAQAIALFHGLLRAGLQPVLLHLRFHPSEQARLLRAVEPAAVLISPEAASAVRLPATVAAIHLPPEPPPAPSAFTPPATPAEIWVPTSGTTAAPKWARLTQDNFFWSALASGYRLGVAPTDRWLLTLPLYHVGGLAILWRSALYGTAIALPPPRASFSAAALADDLQHLGATLVSLVPTMLHRLLQRSPARRPPPSLRLVLLGGAAAPRSLLQTALAHAWPIALTYGLTEATSQVATAPPERVRAKPGSVGRALLFTRVSIRDAEGRPVPPGQVGEIWVQGPTVFAGYWAAPAATARVLRSGWLRTHDAGYVDADGDLWVLARRDDLIVSGGENIAPQEVEAVLQRHPAVAQAAVVGLPDEEWGQIVAAAVVLRPGAKLQPAELQAFCRQYLAGYKVPRRIRVVAQLPLTASGKIRRAAVRAQWLQAEGEES